MKFTYQSYEFVFRDPAQYPASRPVRKVQVIDRAADGSLQVENFNYAITERTLTFKDMPHVDYSNLLFWFDRIVDGATTVFTFEDEYGVSFDVRIISNVYDFKETSYHRYAGSLVLEIV